MTAANTLVGSPVERLEDLRFLRGRGEYVDDLHIDGMLHAAVLRSSVAHGHLKSIDTSAARALQGVHAVITAEDLGDPIPIIPMRLHPLPELEPFWQPVIVHDKVRFVAEPLAVVIADSPAIAEDGVDLIDVDIEPLPAVVNSVDAETAVGAVCSSEPGTNNVLDYKGYRGDMAAFDAAPYRRRERFTVQRHSAVTMEPRGLLAEWDAARQRFSIKGAAKVPFFNRRILAGLMDMPLESIELIENDVGGGFGPRGEFYPEDFLIPFAARLLNRPVKWIEDRRENLMAMNHARECSLRDGDRLRTRRHHYWHARHGYRRCRHLYAHQWRGRRPQHHPIRVRSLSGTQFRCHHHHGRLQQDPGRHLSRARPL